MRSLKLFCLFLALLLAGTSCAIAETAVEFSEATAASVDLANVTGGAVIARDGDTVYYCNNGIWVRRGSEASELLFEDYATSVDLLDGFLYYTDGTQGDRLFRRRLPDGEAEEVVPFSVECLNCCDGRLYFFCARRLEHRGIYSCLPDGGDLQKIGEANCELLFVWDGHVYYADKDEKSSLFRMELSGKKPKAVVKEHVYDAFVNEADQALYYSTTSGFYRSRLDGKGSQLLTAIPAYRICAYGSSIFLSAYAYNRQSEYPTGIFRIDSGSNKIYRISQDQAATLCAAEGALYYKSAQNGLTLMRMGFDGAEPTYVAGGEALGMLDQIDEAGQKAE